MLQLKESELKYLLSLLDDLTEEIYDEVMIMYYDICEKKRPKTFSVDVTKFLKLNLVENPVTVTRVLTFFLQSLEDNNVRDMIQRLYLDTLLNTVNANKAEELISLLCLLKIDDCYLHTLTGNILSNVRGDTFSKYKKQIYISLITQDKPDLLKSCFQEVNDDQNSFKLSSDYMLELAYVHNEHWLLKLLDSYRNQSLDMQKFNFKLNNFSLQLALLRLLDLINGTDTSNVAQKMNHIKNIFTILNSHKMPTKQLEYYITELYREYVIIKFCIDNNFKTLSMNLFHQALRQSTLSIASQLCYLGSLDRYKLSRLLSTNNEMLDKLDALSNSPKDHKSTETLSWDIVVFNSYSLLTMVMDYIINSTKGNKSTDESTAILDDVKVLLLSLQPISYCVEIMENVFSCLFLRFEYFSCMNHDPDVKCNAHSDCSYFVSKRAQNHRHGEQNNIGFMCSSVSTQNILSLLKECIEKVQADQQGCLEEADVLRMNNILRLVNDALWKLQLVSNLSPDQHAVSLKLCLDYAIDFGVSSEDDEFESAHSKKKIKAKRKHTNGSAYNDHMSSSVDVLPNTPPRVSDFISMMLASPNSLISLALHHNDFTRANQIIALFELADTDIATEVIFIENFKELVRKINHIIMCKAEPSSSLKGVTSFSLASANVTSLVESFLSSVRTPNYHDVIELARRQPCLHIYEPKNSALINVIDILHATGQTRDVTYGLISIIESKLSEFKSTRDTSKQYDYVKFIHDVVSIMFEIYGKHDGIQLYADNICGVLNDCKIPLKHKDFNAKLNQYFNELESICGELSQIMDLESITNCTVTETQKLHQSFMNMVSILDKDLCNLSALLPTGSFKPRLRYLKTSYVYMKNVFQLESENVEAVEGVQESSYFSVLPRALHVLIGDLVYKKNVPIARLEPICKKLKINLIHKLLLNFCSPIKISSASTDDEESFNTLLQMVYNYKHMEEDLFVEPNINFSPHFRDIDQVSLTYILHNWVVAYLLKQVHVADLNTAAMQSLDVRTTYLDNYLELQRFQYLKILFGNNKVLTALHSIVDTNEMFKFMTKLVESGKLLKCMQIIDALPESTVLECPNILNLRDLILVTLAIHPNVKYNWQFCYHIKCPELRNDLIMNNLSCWPTEGVLDTLQFLRYTKGCETSVVAKCEDWINRVPIYDQIAKLMQVAKLRYLESWHAVYEKSIENPEEVIQYLMDNHQFAVCLNWANLHDISSSMKYLIISSLLKQLFEYTKQATPGVVADLLELLPTSQAIDLIQSNVLKIKNIDILKTVIDFVNKHGENWRNYENIKIGLEIMSRIELNRRQLFWDIVDKPLLIIEQFLMNAKLETLRMIINHITPLLKSDPEGDDLYYNQKSIHTMVISKNSVDALLRIYAEKALDMKSSKMDASTLASPIKISPEMLMQSLDSINFEVNSGPFVMPEEVPSKEQWVDNCASSKCMVCQIAIFSMLIRRHHCRRCGRLVCHACSRNRLHVPTYPEMLKVRVCDDCSKEMLQSKGLTDADRKTSSCGDSAVSGVTSMDWCLSADNRRNEDVRKEFTFEFTPNVTLCLTIMNMHSINLDYPRFLLDRSDELARAVTHAAAASRLLLRARRALLLAAAELYTRSSDARLADAGAGHAQRRLAHADALALLVKHNCQHLLPPEDALPGHYVRRMLEVEKWDLALEIATKSGLPRTGVLAAWGKACLKAGCFKQAREKFSHCFKSTVAPTVSEWAEDCEFGKEAAEVTPMLNKTRSKLLMSDRTNSLSSIQSESIRPKVNPPLLNEIISILENINYSVNSQLVAKAESIQATNEKLAAVRHGNKKLILQEPALNIMHALSSIQKIKQADYSDFCIATQKKPKATGLLRRPNQNETKFDRNYNKLNPYFFKECTYYLLDYGSHSGNISFHLKHSSLTDVLKYCCDNMVEKEIFTESVYLDCLRRGKVNELLRSMSELDGSWENWTEYLINTCRVLESTGRLDALYNLQCVVGEHARAAATCARLYSAVALSGTGGAALVTSMLKSRQHHLTAARGHLLQCTPSENTKNYPSNSLYLQLDKTMLDKHITTISRQMEVVEFLSKCQSKERLTDKIFKELVPMPANTSRTESSVHQPLTLFGSHSDKMKLAALCIFCGQNVGEGFDLAHKIISDSKLDAMRVYSHVVRYLVRCERFMEIKMLGKCIKSRPDSDGSLMSDQVLEMGVAAIVRQCDTYGQLFDEQAELLIEDIHSITIKISCYIECRILATAYILAARNNRTSDLKRILREAERLGQDKVRSACMKRLSAKNLL